MSDLWEKLKTWVITGREARKVEFKRMLDLGPRPNGTKLAQLVTAMANTPGGTGYILLGVVDRRARSGVDLADAVCGIDHDPEEFERRLQQVLVEAANPVPPVRYEVITVPEIDQRIGVIVVEPSAHRPHELVRSTDGVERGCYIRRGAETFIATRDELKEMFDSKNSAVVVVNFAHPITAAQCEQVRSETGVYIADIIDAPAHFDDNQPFAPQVRYLLDSVGLTQEEWQTLPLVVNVAAYAPIATTLIAEIHGRAGYFPTILRLKRSADTGGFVFAELMKLQHVRDSARGLR